MSIHADDEFNLRLALMSELDDVAPGDELAGLVIARHRKVRRLRFAGVCGLFVVFAGIGVPIGVASASGGPAKSRPVELRLGSYTLTLSSRARGSKTVTTQDKAEVTSVKVDGYILSPREPRILVVVSERRRGFEGYDDTLRFYGAHLAVGFRK